MTPREHADYLHKQRWLTDEQAAQWTEPVREAWLAMRKAHKVWEQACTPPTLFYGSIKEEGESTPKFIVNEPYARYAEALERYRAVEPRYINENRARLSNGDFEPDPES